MAVQTLTSTVFDNVLKQVHTGNVTVGGSFARGATTNTLSDIVFLAKIPHGAIVVDMYSDHTTPATAMGVKYGLASGAAGGGGASVSCFAAATAKATVARLGVGNQNRRVSVSDSDPNRYGIFCAVLSTGTTTESYAINFSITYRNDE